MRSLYYGDSPCPLLLGTNPILIVYRNGIYSVYRFNQLKGLLLFFLGLGLDKYIPKYIPTPYDTTTEQTQSIPNILMLM